MRNEKRGDSSTPFLSGGRLGWGRVSLLLLMLPPAAIGQPTLGEMVSIPARPFTMGSNEGAQDERSAHEVNLAAFWIDRLPVTNARYAQFLNGGGHDSPANEIMTTQRGRTLSRNLPRAITTSAFAALVSSAAAIQKERRRALKRFSAA
jgi:formylglycine-generating enzyme required for sulfatase activity